MSPAFREQAIAGNVLGALRSAIVTGVVVAQATSWDQFFGAVVAETMTTDSTITTTLLKSIFTTIVGATVIYTMHCCTDVVSIETRRTPASD